MDLPLGRGSLAAHGRARQGALPAHRRRLGQAGAAVGRNGPPVFLGPGADSILIRCDPGAPRWRRCLWKRRLPNRNGVANTRSTDGLTTLVVILQSGRLPIAANLPIAKKGGE